MVKHGPVDIYVLALGEPRFDGKVLTELERQAEAGVIRVLDAMILFKDAVEECSTLDLEDLPRDQRQTLGFIETGTRGFFDSEDSDALFEGMCPGSAVVALAIEHAWAVTLINALNANGVEVALNVRVPSSVINEIFTS